MNTSDSANGDPAIVTRTVMHRGRKFNFEMLTVRRPSGNILQREIVRHPGAVTVVPVLEEAGEKKVVLIRNHRISVGQRLLECCAGTIERPRQANGDFGHGEDPAVCAARELVEETGYEPGHVRPIEPGWFYTTPGLTDERMFVFIATELTFVGQKLEEDEAIDVVTVPARQAVAWAADGTMRDAKSMLSILLADRAGLL